MSPLRESSWNILFQSVAGASRSMLFLVSCLWLLVSLPVHAIVDANNNGLSDLWEKAHNNGNLFPSNFDSQADPDGDGWTNAQEAAAGTDPFDANAPDGFLRPEILHTPAVIGDTNGDNIEEVITPEVLTVSWPTLTGKQYTLQYSPDLAENSWQDVDLAFLGHGYVSEYHFLADAADRIFWRVTIEDYDSDFDGVCDAEEDHLGTNPYLWDTDGDGLGDGEEILGGTNPLNRDTDGDWIPDGIELFYGYFPTDATDGMLDSDNDGIPNKLEYVFLDQGYDPSVWNDVDTFPWDEDPDNDGLTTRQEFGGPVTLSSQTVAPQSLTSTTDTHPRKFDSDSDGLPDGWEASHELDPNSATGNNGTHGDPDSDEADNFTEWLYETHPQREDTDSGGVADGIEINRGTDPNQGDDDSDPPPPHEFEDVPFRVGDPSYSRSEKWKMLIRGLGPDDHMSRHLTSPGFGVSASGTYKLRKGNRYEISISHLETDPDYLDQYQEADYDWEAMIDGKPNTISIESIDGLPGANNYFTASGHWIVDNRQAVFTTEKHGDSTNIVTGHTALLIPGLQRDEDVIDNNWEPIAGQIAKALPGQKINLRIDPTVLGYGFSFSDPLWSAPSKSFKDYRAGQNEAVLTLLNQDDLNQDTASFYFGTPGSKEVTVAFKINDESFELKAPLQVDAPIAAFARVVGSIKKITDIFGNERIGLYEQYPYTHEDDIYYGINCFGSVILPSEGDEGHWNWVQTVTPNVTLVDKQNITMVLTDNGQFGVDGRYPAAPLPTGDHPGNAGSHVTGAPSSPSNQFGDSPSVGLTDFKSFTFAAELTTYLMFLPDGEESRYVPLKSMNWDLDFSASLNLNTLQWNIDSSNANAEEPHEEQEHPIWNKRITTTVIPAPSP